MKKFVKIISVLMIAVILAATFAGCNSENTDTNTPSNGATDVNAVVSAVKVVDLDLTSEQYAFGVDKAQPELLEAVNNFINKIKADGRFDEICNKYFGDGTPTPVESAELDPSKDQLVVATNAAFEPFEYTKGKNFYGIDMEIAALLAKELGKELVITHMDFDAVCLSVGQHKCDIAMAGLTIKPDREVHVNFSIPYYEASQKIITLGDDTTFDDCEDAASVEAILAQLPADTKIGVQNGTTGQYYVEGDEDWGFDGYNVKCVGYKNGSLAVQDLINGGVDYVIIDSAPAKCITDAMNKFN